MANPKQLFKDTYELLVDVKQKLRNQGFVVPKRNRDGSVSVGSYTIIKDRAGLYKILNSQRQSIFHGLNLPQTAIIVANDLALKKMWIDQELLAADRQYGYSVFEEQQCSRLIQKTQSKQDWSRADIMQVKQGQAKIRADQAKKTVLARYAKMNQIR